MKKKGKDVSGQKKPNAPLQRSGSISSQSSSSSKRSKKKKAKYGTKKESGDIENQEQLEDIDYLLRIETVVGREFNTNIMRIALNMQEEQIASIITA